MANMPHWAANFTMVANTEAVESDLDILEIQPRLRTENLLPRTGCLAVVATSVSSILRPHFFLHFLHITFYHHRRQHLDSDPL